MIRERLLLRAHFLAVLVDPRGRPLASWRAPNIITTAGEVFWRERMIDQALPTNFTTGAGVFDAELHLGDDATPAAPAKGSDYSALQLIAGATAAPEAGYPLLGDTDPLNTGAGANVISIKYLFGPSGSDWTGISQMVLTNPSPGATEPVASYSISSNWNPPGPRTKPMADALAVFYNLTAAGNP